MDIYLICDESGAKGCSDISEAYPGETGVFAGYLVDQDQLPIIRDRMTTIAYKYFANAAKYHIADLPNEKKEELRREVFEVIEQSNLTCIYEAIHVEGFKAEHDRIQEIKNDAKKSTRSGIRISSNVKKDSLHEVLFQGLFAKAIAHCIDTFSNVYKLIVLIDRLDGPVYKSIKGSANELTDFSPSETKVTGWDPRSQQVVKGSIKMMMNIPESYGMSDIENAVFELNMDEKNSPLMLGADILANSINYVFKSRVQEDIGKPLNNKSSVQAHQLFGQFYGLMDETDQAWTSDIIYMHPLERDRGMR